MNIIVIGGSGFIGSNLIKELSKYGYSIISIDNYLTGTVENHHDNVSYLSKDASYINELDFNADIVFHLGEYSRVEQSDEEPWLCLRNTYQTLPSVLEYCYKKKAKLVYSGSSTKFSEKSNPYIVAKKFNTELVKLMCEQYSMDYAITYFYNAYGNNEISTGKYATVVAKFIQAKKENRQVKITGNGKQKRHFTHVEDIVNGLIKVAFKGYGDNYGIGSPESISIIELATIIGVDYVLSDDKNSNRKLTELRTEKTIELGWKAKHSIFEYLSNINFSE